MHPHRQENRISQIQRFLIFGKEGAEFVLVTRKFIFVLRCRCRFLRTADSEQAVDEVRQGPAVVVVCNVIDVIVRLDALVDVVEGAVFQE